MYLGSRLQGLDGGVRGFGYGAPGFIHVDNFSCWHTMVPKLESRIESYDLVQP